jgi:hypothetical protein
VANIALGRIERAEIWAVFSSEFGHAFASHAEHSSQQNSVT